MKNWIRKKEWEFMQKWKGEKCSFDWLEDELDESVRLCGGKERFLQMWEDTKPKLQKEYPNVDWSKMITYGTEGYNNKESITNQIIKEEMKLKVKTEKQVIKERAKIDKLFAVALDKVNLLNRKQIEVLDQYKAILRHPCVDDLSYLIRILDKELKHYPEPLNDEIGGV